jgi:hypothetical protein
MDAISRALACAPTGWLSYMQAGKSKVTSAELRIPICLFYTTGLF